MKRALALLLALTLIVPLAPRPAHAGCCDDFFGCVGTVLTGGASCALAEAIKAIDNFTKMLREARDKGRAEMQGAINGFKEAGVNAAKEAREQMEQMVAAADKASKEAKSLAGSATLQVFQKTVGARAAAGPEKALATGQVAVGGGSASASKGGAVGSPGAAMKGPGQAASTIKPAPQTGSAAQAAGVGAAAKTRDSGLDVHIAAKLADADRARNAMKEGDKQTAAALTSTSQRKTALEVQAKMTDTEARNRAGGLMTLLDTAYLAPLATMIAFFAAGDPLALAASLAVMATQLNAIKKALEDQVDPAVKAASDNLKVLMDALDKRTREAALDVDRAKKTVQLMQKLAQTKLQSDLTALEAHLGITHAATTAASSALLTTGAGQTAGAAAQAMAKSLGLHRSSRDRALAASRVLKSSLEAPIAMAASFTLPTAPAAASFQARVNTDVDAQFRGRSGTDLARRRDELIAEARAYYTRDPRTLEAVERFLREQAAARGAR